MQCSVSGDTLELSITATDGIVKHNDLCDLKAYLSLKSIADTFIFFQPNSSYCRRDKEASCIPLIECSPRLCVVFIGT